MIQINIDSKAKAVFLSISKADYTTKDDFVPWAAMVAEKVKALGWLEWTLHTTVRDYFARGKPLMTKVAMGERGAESKRQYEESQRILKGQGGPD